MAKVKINNEEYLQIITDVEKTQEYVLKAIEAWETNFDNLYNNFITNGFLESLYKDAESQYYTSVQTGKNVVCWTTGLAGVGATIGSVFPIAGTAIGAAVGALLGLGVALISELANPREPQWSYTSKIVLENLLTECVYGNNDAYLKLINTNTKMEHVYVTLYQILSKINEFNKLYAQITETANEMNLKTNVADDGVTLLDINTDVVIDGEMVELSISDAMNAFYTYSGTVISAAVQATYMEETYGADINYRDLVKNANSFMSETIQSGLYSQEFVDHILPEYSPSKQAALQTTSELVGATTAQVESVLDKSGTVLGTVGLFSGLIGATYIGPVVLNDKVAAETPIGTGDSAIKNPSDDSSSNVKTEVTKPVKDDTVVKDPSGNDKNKNKDKDEVKDNAKDNDKTKEKGKDKTKDKNKEVKEEKKVEIVKVTDTELKPIENIKKIEKDYDFLARIEYEAQGESAITQKRLELIEEANTLFENKDALQQKLQQFGYSESDISRISEDRSATIQAIVEGGTKQELAEIANRLAGADNVTDFNTVYNEKANIDDLYNGKTDEFLLITSSDPKVKSSYEFVLDIKDSYDYAVKAANEAVEAQAKAKADLDSLKATFVKNSGDDMSKWANEQIKAYNEKVTEYNKLVEEANVKIDKVDEAYSSYETSMKIYEQNKTNFYNEVKIENQNIADMNNSNVTVEEGTVLPDVSEPVDSNEVVFDDFRSTSDEDLLNLI